MPNDPMRLDDAASRDLVPGKDISPGPSMPSQNEAAQGEASGIGLAASAPHLAEPCASAAPTAVIPQEQTDHADADVWGFTRHYTYVAQADKFYDFRSGTYLKVSAVERLYAHIVGGLSNIKGALVEGPHAVEKVHAVTFKPGGERFVTESHSRLLNLWRPAEIQPVAGDPALFLAHIKYIFDGDEEVISYVLNYMAHLIQKPGQKIPAAILLTGRQGTGKSLIAQILRKMVGLHNSTMLSPIDLMSQFNSFIERSIVTVVEEMTPDDRKGTAARLKAWISEPEAYINRKGIPQYKVPNQTHFIVLSNEATPLVIEEDDRRFLVWASAAAPKEPEYYTTLVAWLEAEGYGCILHFLLNRDLSGFNPHQPPPRTQARAELIRSSQSDLEAFLREAFEANEAPFNRDLITVADVERAASNHGLRTKQRDVTTHLKNMGAKAIGQKRVGGQKLRIWAIKNQSRWQGAAEGEIAEAYRAGAGRGASQPVRRGAPPPERLAVGTTASGDAIPDAAGEQAAEAVAS